MSDKTPVIEIHDGKARFPDIHVGCHVSERGEPLVVVNGQPVSTVDALDQLLLEYRVSQVTGAARRLVRRGLY